MARTSVKGVEGSFDVSRTILNFSCRERVFRTARNLLPLAKVRMDVDRVCEC